MAAKLVKYGARMKTAVTLSDEYPRPDRGLGKGTISDIAVPYTREAHFLRNVALIQQLMAYPEPAGDFRVKPYGELRQAM
jgi:hypothetical protein